jgi:hypothetical protein
MNTYCLYGLILGYTARADIGISCGLISGYTAKTAGYHHQERLDNWWERGGYYVGFYCFRFSSRGEIYRERTSGILTSWAAG